MDYKIVRYRNASAGFELLSKHRLDIHDTSEGFEFSLSLVDIDTSSRNLEHTSKVESTQEGLGLSW